MGQSKCGHQIGLVNTTRSWRTWALGDADLHKDGCGPLFIRFGPEFGKHDWWNAWRTLVHVTKYAGGQMCQFSPHNFRNDHLDALKSGKRGSVGTNSIDVVMFYDGKK
jgi:hypothetical protein